MKLIDYMQSDYVVNSNGIIEPLQGTREELLIASDELVPIQPNSSSIPTYLKIIILLLTFLLFLLECL